MATFTKGFLTPTHLADHFHRHGADLGITTEAEYLAQADLFCGAPLDPPDPHIHEAIRPRDGDLLRYNDLTDEFGVQSKDGVIRTYYRLTGAVKKYGSGIAYFQEEAAKR